MKRIEECTTTYWSRSNVNTIPTERLLGRSLGIENQTLQLVHNFFKQYFCKASLRVPSTSIGKLCSDKVFIYLSLDIDSSGCIDLSPHPNSNCFGRNHRIPHHHDPALASAECVTLTFEDQKNGTKMDRRTHQRTGDPILCPIRRIASLIVRVYRTIPSASDDTPINAIYLSARESRVPSGSLRTCIRSTCTCGGGKPRFGYSAADIGTKSIRSGAAMSLFLMNHPVHKIMILGRWSLDAFLVYVVPKSWNGQTKCPAT